MVVLFNMRVTTTCDPERKVLDALLANPEHDHTKNFDVNALNYKEAIS